MRHPATSLLYTYPPLKWLRAIAQREQSALREEVLRIKGLMPLLMKPRNHGAWTPREREALLLQLRPLSTGSPYLAILFMPGGFMALPALAWWLDRRRRRGRAFAPGH